LCPLVSYRVVSFGGEGVGRRGGRKLRRWRWRWTL
jgi:hypothetical protein